MTVVPIPPKRRRRTWCSKLLLRIAVVFFLGALYWCFSGGLTLYNKWLLSQYGFKYPIFMIICTYSMNFILVALFRYGSKALLPAGWVSYQTVTSRVYFRYLVPIAVASALEISTSNMSLLFLSVSFHTMVQASKPAFVLLWSIVLGLEPFRWRLILIVMTIALGVLIVSIGEFREELAEEAEFERLNASMSDSSNSTLEKVVYDKFSLSGFLMVMFSCFCSGARWSITQLLLHSGDLDVKSADEVRTVEITEGGSPVRRKSSIQDQQHRGNATAAVSGTSATTPTRKTNEKLSSITLSGHDDDDEDEEVDDSEDVDIPLDVRNGMIARVETTKKSRHAMTPTNLLFFLSPICIVSLIPLFFAFEYPMVHFEHESQIAGLLIACGFLALGLILVEFAFIRLTSSLSLSICAIFKELLLVMIASAVYGDTLGALNLIGFSICISGIIAYNVHFYHRLNRASKSVSQQDTESFPKQPVYEHLEMTTSTTPRITSILTTTNNTENLSPQFVTSSNNTSKYQVEEEEEVEIEQQQQLQDEETLV